MSDIESGYTNDINGSASIEETSKISKSIFLSPILFLMDTKILCFISFNGFTAWTGTINIRSISPPFFASSTRDPNSHTAALSPKVLLAASRMAWIWSVVRRMGWCGSINLQYSIRYGVGPIKIQSCRTKPRVPGQSRWRQGWVWFCYYLHSYNPNNHVA